MEKDKAKQVIRPTDAEAVLLAKTLIRTARFGALAVIDPADGAPAASRVAVATDGDGAPIILVSALSGHTTGLAADPRCSLLVGEPGKGDPLAHPRISVACRARRIACGTADHTRIARRYLNRHPKAKLYVDFPDFTFFRLQPQKASLNGGFGKAYVLTRGDLMTQSAANAGLAEIEQSAIEHMNADHRDAVTTYARAYARADGEGWIVTGFDADGIDIGRGDEARRVPFPAPLSSAEELRPTLAAMARHGRESFASE